MFMHEIFVFTWIDYERRNEMKWNEVIEFSYLLEGNKEEEGI